MHTAHGIIIITVSNTRLTVDVHIHFKGTLGVMTTFALVHYSPFVCICSAFCCSSRSAPVHQMLIALFIVHISPPPLSSGLLVEEEYRAVQSVRAARVACIQAQRCKRQSSSVAFFGRKVSRRLRPLPRVRLRAQRRISDHGQLMQMCIGVAAMTLA